MFKKILIANRGAIACRILRTVKRMGIGSVAVYSEADENSMHVRLADEAYCIGPAPAAESYLRGERILEVARAVRRGGDPSRLRLPVRERGFRADVRSTRAWPSSGRRRHRCATSVSSTRRARWRRQRGLPLLPGTELLADLPAALAAAERIGYPVMLKSTAGGGGIGMRRCNSAAASCSESFAAVQRLAARQLPQRRRVPREVRGARAAHRSADSSAMGAAHVIALGERDCSVQRRNQKVIEESPAPGPRCQRTRGELHDAAVRLGERGATTDRRARWSSCTTPRAAKFYFLEVNTRLQVEHGVTEEVGGIDLVEWMIRTAAGEPPDLRDASARAARPRHPGARLRRGSGARLPALERPAHAGLTTCAERSECASTAGSRRAPRSPPTTIPCSPRSSRAARRASSPSPISRPRSRRHASTASRPTCAYLVSVLEHPAFAAGEQTTALLASHAFQPTSSIEVLAAGTLTTVQDWPGRLGLWDVGVPPSGPMDRAGAAPRQSHGGQRGRRGGARDDGHRRDAALRRRRGDRARRRGDGCQRSTGAPFHSGSRCREARQPCSRSDEFAAPASAPISRCAAVSTFPNTSAAARRSRSDSSAATADARCARATCCD